MLVETLKDKYITDSCYSANDAFVKIKVVEYDVIVTDLKLNDGTGIDVLQYAKNKDPYVEVIIITGYGTLETASEAINLGVTSYLNKPLKLNDFCVQVERSVATRLFHLQSLNLIDQAEYGAISDAKEHILDITSLYYFTSKLMISLDVSEIMKIIMREINDKLNTQYCVVGINYLKFCDVFAMPAQGNIESADVVKNLLSAWDDSFKVFNKEDFETNQVSIYTFGGKDIPKDNSTENKNYGNLISLPMSILGEKLGFIALYRKDAEAFNKKREQFFHVFTSLISSAVQHCYLDAVAKQQAKTDSLTGVSNHRMFHECMDRELSRSRRYERDFCLAILDIDDFKNVNDTYGHLVGDAVLIDLTERIIDVIRLGDIIARYGGEEFAIILSDTDLEGARILANRVCRAISDKPFVFSSSDIYYTVSVGLVLYDHNNPLDKKGLIGMADKALYSAKRNGKNRVVVSQIEKT